MTKSEIEKEISGLYITTLGRAAEKEGLAYWTEQVVNGAMTVSQVGQSFFDQKEVKEKYSDLNTTEFVQAVYINVLGREAEEEGLNYWTTQLDNDVFSKSSFIEAINNGAKGDDILRLDNLKVAGFYYTSKVGFGNDFTKQVLLSIDSSSDSLNSAVATIDYYNEQVDNISKTKEIDKEILWDNINNDKYLSGLDSNLIKFSDKDNSFWENGNNEFINDASLWLDEALFDDYQSKSYASLDLSSIEISSNESSVVTSHDIGLGQAIYLPIKDVLYYDLNSVDGYSVTNIDYEFDSLNKVLIQTDNNNYLSKNTYDKNGNQLSEISYNEDGTIDTKAFVTYNDKNQITKAVAEFYQDNLLLGTITTENEWTENKVISKTSGIKSDGEKFYTDITSIGTPLNDSQTGALIQSVDSDTDGKVDYINYYTYDELGHEIKLEEDTNADGVIDSITTTEWMLFV